MHSAEGSGPSERQPLRDMVPGKPLPLHYRGRLLPPRLSISSEVEGYGHRLRAPSCPPLPAASVESVQTRIVWWEYVLAWLRDLNNAIEESINKELTDISALARDSEDGRSAGFYIVTFPFQQMPDGPRPPLADDNMDNDLGVREFLRLTKWGRWEKQQRDFQTCGLKKVFYAPNHLAPFWWEKPPSSQDVLRAVSAFIDTPYSDDVLSSLSGFTEAHERYLFKHWEHLEFLLHLINDKLIPQAEGRLEDLLDELNERKLAAQWPTRADLMSGVLPKEAEIDDYPYPSSEDDYPDEDDEVHGEMIQGVEKVTMSSGDEPSNSDG